MNRFVRATLVLGAVGMAFATTAEAHRAQVKSNLIRLDGVKDGGYLFMRPQQKGRVTLTLPSHPVNGKLVIDYRLNGQPIPGYAYPLTADQQVFDLGLVTKDQDKVE